MGSFKNFLYDHAKLYDEAFPDQTSSSYCLSAIKRYAAQKPRSILDLGCGTGSTLEILSKKIACCVGIDLLPSMIEYGKKVRPNLDLRVGDMTQVNLLRTFDVVCCFGWAFSYLLTDPEIQEGIKAFARHAHPGTLLTFDCGQADAYMSMKSMPTPVTEIETHHYKATAHATLDLDRIRLLLTRKRIWELPGGERVTDTCQYRLHHAHELKEKLEKEGFEVLEMAGDPAGKKQAPDESTLYVTAIKKRGSSGFGVGDQHFQKGHRPRPLTPPSPASGRGEQISPSCLDE
jgi:SAM-dependent methyltransferase